MSDNHLGPDNLAAEEDVLSAMLANERAIERAIDVVRAKDFARENHRLIFLAAVDLYGRSAPVTIPSVADELEKRGQLDAVGGPSRLAELAALGSPAGNVAHHAGIVRDLATARELQRVGTEIATLGATRPGEIEELLDRAERLLFDLSRGLAGGDLITIAKGIGEAYETITRMHELGLDVVGLPTGLRDLDRLLSGLHRGNLIVIASRPSMGKSGLAFGLAAYAAVDLELPAAIISLEMSEREVSYRSLSRLSRLPLDRLTTGKLHGDEWKKLAAASATLEKAPLYVDESAPNVAELRSRVRRLATRENELALVVVDYLQLMPTGNASELVAELGSITRSLKLLARQIDVPVVVCSQLSRSCENRVDKRPILSDLRDSGAIEQDADVAIFPYRDHYYREDADPAVAELIVRKNRNGRLATVEAAWHAQTATFTDLATPR